MDKLHPLLIPAIMDELHPLRHPHLALFFPSTVEEVATGHEKVASTVGGAGTCQGKSYNHINLRCWIW